MSRSADEMDIDRAKGPRLVGASDPAQPNVSVVLNIVKRDNWNTDVSRGSWTRILSNLLGESSDMATVRLYFKAFLSRLRTGQPY